MDSKNMDEIEYYLHKECIDVIKQIEKKNMHQNIL